MSKCLIRSTRLPASRQTAKASINKPSSVSPTANRLRNVSVCSFNSAVLNSREERQGDIGSVSEADGLLHHPQSQIGATVEGSSDRQLVITSGLNTLGI